MAGQTGPSPDPDGLAEERLDARTDDLIVGAWTRMGCDRGHPDPVEIAPAAWGAIRFAVAMSHPGLDLDWVADFALKYTGE